MGVVMSHDLVKFQGPSHISGMIEARIFKILTLASYIKCYQKDDIAPPEWTWLWSRDH